MPNTHDYFCDYVHPVRHYKNGLYLPMDLGKSLKYSSEEFPDFNLGNNSCLAKVGLSYSSFEYGDLKLSADKLRPGEKIMATVQFKNTEIGRASCRERV